MARTRSRTVQHRRFSTLLWVCLGLTLTGCSDTEDGSRTESSTRVQVATAETMTLNETVRGIGTLRAQQTVEIRPETAGKIARISFDEGERVEAGNTLIELDTRKLERELSSRQAALEAARARRDNASLELERLRPLYQQNAASEDSLNQAETNLRAARAEVNQLASQVELANERLADARMTAPFTGRIAESMVDAGDFVQPGSHLATMYKTATLELEFRLPERFIDRIRKGQPVSVTVPAFPNEEFEATTTFVSPSINERTRDFLVKATIDNTGGRLKPGGFASVQLTIDQREDVVALPEEALIATRKGYLVFVVDDEDRAERRPVEIGLRNPGVVQITEGLETGERVVRTGHMRVGDGSPLNIAGDDAVSNKTGESS